MIWGGSSSCRERNRWPLASTADRVWMCFVPTQALQDHADDETVGVERIADRVPADRELDHLQKLGVVLGQRHAGGRGHAVRVHVVGGDGHEEDPVAPGALDAAMVT